MICLILDQCARQVTGSSGEAVICLILALVAIFAIWATIKYLDRDGS